ncbi:MAG: type I DNA topoisomerase [Clostridia bacterium]|nr:type I DNA topoisomerase [Clostridia bacterium]
MADTLVIVESPAKAKTIGKFLGSKYKVVASNGHVRDLPKSTLGVDPEKKFKPKYITLRGRGDVLETIRREAKDAKRVLLATDPDREGEAISWHLAEILSLDVKDKCRIEFNEITSNAVKNSIKHPRTIDMHLVDAQQARRVLDRLVGYKISPILWHKVQKGLSAGRVQSVATRIICDREEEINEFVPEEYWTIVAKLNGAKTFETKYFGEQGKKRDVHTEAEATEIKKRVEKAEFTVTECKTAERRKHAPAPFTTSGLQQEASRKLGFTTKRTMMVAQQLYEGVELGKRGPVGLITYIRTDSVRVASEAQEAARAFIGQTFGKAYVPEKPNIYKGRRGAQDAHEAIRPTDLGNDPKTLKEHLSPEQWKLYKLIYERFVASQMAEQVQSVTSVTFDANGATFKSSGARTLFDGYTVLYTESKDEEDSEVNLPAIAENDRFTAKSIDAQQRFTQPPSRYTEASLVRALEEKGIGRPSTYAPTISTIIDRGYVARDKKLLAPTELGFIVTNLMKKSFPDIVDVAFTAKMEEELDEVEEGTIEWTSLMESFYGPFMETVQKADEQVEKVKIPDEVSDVVCDKCGAMMVYKTGRFGKFLACPNFPACRNAKPIIEKLDVPCPKCGSAVLKRRSKKGNTFYGCERYPECDFTSWNPLVAQKCPKCGGYMVQKRGRNGTFVACADPKCSYILRDKKKKDEE